MSNFIYHDDYSWYVASSQEEALRMYEDDTGLKIHEDYEPEEWTQCDPAGILTIRDEDGQHPLTFTHEEWAVLSAPGFLCSTEV